MKTGSSQVAARDATAGRGFVDLKRFAGCPIAKRNPNRATSISGRFCNIYGAPEFFEVPGRCGGTVMSGIIEFDWDIIDKLQSQKVGKRVARHLNAYRDDMLMLLLIRRDVSDTSKAFIRKLLAERGLSEQQIEQMKGVDIVDLLHQFRNYDDEFRDHDSEAARQKLRDVICGRGVPQRELFEFPIEEGRSMCKGEPRWNVVDDYVVAMLTTVPFAEDRPADNDVFWLDRIFHSTTQDLMLLCQRPDVSSGLKSAINHILAERGFDQSDIDRLSVVRLEVLIYLVRRADTDEWLKTKLLEVLQSRSIPSAVIEDRPASDHSPTAAVRKSYWNVRSALFHFISLYRVTVLLLAAVLSAGLFLQVLDGLQSGKLTHAIAQVLQGKNPTNLVPAEIRKKEGPSPRVPAVSRKAQVSPGPAKQVHDPDIFAKNYPVLRADIALVSAAAVLPVAVLLFASFVLVAATAIATPYLWRPTRVLLLRPFGPSRISKPLRRFLRRRVRGLGQVITLSDRGFRPSVVISVLSAIAFLIWYLEFGTIRFLIGLRGFTFALVRLAARLQNAAIAVIGVVVLVLLLIMLAAATAWFAATALSLLFGNSVRVARINDRGNVGNLRSSMSEETFELARRWFLSGGEPLNIRSGDACWHEVIAMLIAEADVIMIDTSQLKPSELWELDKIRSLGFFHKCMVLERDAKFADGKGYPNLLALPSVSYAGRPNRFDDVSLWEAFAKTFTASAERRQSLRLLERLKRAPDFATSAGRVRA